MGTWGPGPFDNDAAADFLDRVMTAPSRIVTKTLREISKTPAGNYIDVDAGGAGFAACELVALAFGYGAAASAGDGILDAAGKLGAKEEQRKLALDVLSRLADPKTSELAGLWHEGEDGPQFEASVAQLGARLQEAGNGARELPKAKTGDVIGLDAPNAGGLIVVQAVGPREIAVMEGTYADDAAALVSVKKRPAHRVPCSVNKLLRRGRLLGNVPVRKDLKGKKLYADEAGGIVDYVLATASGGGLRIVTYDEVRDCDLLRLHGESAICAVALGTKPNARVRSPEEREAELTARNAVEWTARREATTPGPFGDVENLGALIQWIEDYGVENAVQRFHEEALGMSGYGRPNEDPERRSYAFAGIVALWRETLSLDVLPAQFRSRLPARPNDALMAQAVSTARTLSDRVITRDSELRMIWESGPDRGTGLRLAVQSLKEVLS